MNAISKTAHGTQWVPVKNLSVVWRQAQRDLDERWVKQLSESFDPDLFGTLTVTLPNGNGIYHVIDGHHRTCAIRALFGEDEKVPCNVFEIDDPARAAQMFDKINSNRKHVTAVQTFKVRVTAGSETEVAVDRIVRSCGLRIAPASVDGGIRAVNACVSLYKRFGGEAFRLALKLICDTFGKDSDATDANIIRAYTLLYAQHTGHFDRARMVERVAKQYTPGRLLAAGRAGKEMFSGKTPECIAAILVKTYNHGLRSGLIEDNPRKKTAH